MTAYLEDYMGYTIKIQQDDYPFDPRKEFSYIGTMECWHRNYSLGDNQHDRDDFGQWLYEQLIQHGIEYKWGNEPFRPISKWGIAKHVQKIIDDDEYDQDGYAIRYTWDDFSDDLYSDDPDCIHEALVRLKPHIIMLPLYLYDHSGISISTGPFCNLWDSGQIGFIWADVTDVKAMYNWKRLTEQRREFIQEILVSEVNEYDQFLRGEVYDFYIYDNEHDLRYSCGNIYGFDEALRMAKEEIDLWI